MNNGYVPPQPGQRQRRGDRARQSAPTGQGYGYQPMQEAASVKARPQEPYRPSGESGFAVPPGTPGNYAAQTPKGNAGTQRPSYEYNRPGAPRQGYGGGYYPPPVSKSAASQAGRNPRQGQSQPGYAPQQADPRYAGGQQAYYQAMGTGGQPPQPPRQPSFYQQGGGGGQPPKKRPVGRIILLTLALLVLLGVAGVAGFRVLQDRQVQQYVEPYNNRFVQGVYVDGIHLGGMSPDEGVAAVTAQVQQRSDAWSVRLMYQGTLMAEITDDQLGMTVDVMDVMSEAWRQGHTGDAYQRKAEMESLQTQPYEAYTALPSGDTSAIDTILDQLRNQLYAAPQNAAIIEFDPSKTEPFTFQEEVYGRILNTEPIKEQLYRMVSTMESGEVELVPDAIAPQVTVEQLRKTVALRATAYTDISTRSEENRNNNIRRAFQQISGTIIQPGGTFSFNDIVGRRTIENGFYEADEYAYNETVRGVGGGVCQASSIMYLAAVQAGMEIVKREPHSKEVNYTEYGKDATVYWEYGRKIDFSFRNNTNSPIYITAAVQSSPQNRKRLIARVSIYGEDLEGVTYQLETITTQVLKPTDPVVTKDKEGKYVTYTDQQKTISKAKDGCVVDSYRVKYLNGTEIDRTFLYTDTYKARAEQIVVGVTER